MALTKVQNTGIADDAITTDKIENSTVLAEDLAASSITNAKIATGTIANAKLTNSSITVNGTSISLGGSTTLKHIDWQAVTVADGSTTLTAEAGKGYFLDTNTGVIEVFLPSSPSRGDTIVLADYGGNFATNQIIINTGGNLIDSTSGPDFKVNTNNAVVELVYVDSNKGWLVKLNQAAGTTPDAIVTGNYDTKFIEATGGTVTTDGDFKIHTFTGDGNFVVSSLGNEPATKDKVDYLVIAGGAGGGSGANDSDNTGGGGGAGGYRESQTPAISGTYTASPLKAACGALTITATTFPITVGGGGAQQTTAKANGNDGSNSVFSTITSAGGGGGGAGHAAPSCHSRNGRNGGSGGGGSGGTSPSAPGGSGNTPPVSPAQGTDGGDYAGTSPDHASTGGGGAGGGAENKPGGYCGLAGGPGGPGTTTAINGTATGFAGGGGGGAGVCGCASNNHRWPNGRAASPGISQAATAGFGGASGGRSRSFGGSAGTANKGAGGGGGGGSAPQGPGAAPIFYGGAGGSGIVIIRYKFQ